MTAATQKVSFTVRRPTPVSRATSSGGDSDSPSLFKVPVIPQHLASPNDSKSGSPLARSATSSPKPTSTRGVSRYEELESSDEDDDESLQEELVVGFDKFGVQRLNQNKKKKQGALVIPALKDRDWREIARKRRSAGQYLPPSANGETGTDGSISGLGVKDTMTTSSLLAGLQVKKREVHIKQENGMVATGVTREDVKMEELDETEDQKALRAILQANGTEMDGPMIDIIPTPISEADAYKQDVDELPDASTLEDYARIPVSQFGAAMLRGMGWKEGMAASRKPGRGIIEPYLPEARPALLGIGAKEMEVFDDGSKRRSGHKARPEKKYVPVVKKEREGSSGGFGRRERSFSPTHQGDSSRRSSRSLDGRRNSRQNPGSRRDERDYDRRDDRDRDYIRDGRDGDRERGRRDNSDRARHRDRSQESSRRKNDH